MLLPTILILGAFGAFYFAIYKALVKPWEPYKENYGPIHQKYPTMPSSTIKPISPSIVKTTKVCPSADAEYYVD